jgi:hypothetical protein
MASTVPQPHLPGGEVVHFDPASPLALLFREGNHMELRCLCAAPCQVRVTVFDQRVIVPTDRYALIIADIVV